MKAKLMQSEKLRDDPEKKYLQLNRLEDYLLKPVIPFIRIGHLPRGRYFQLKGDLIMVSADVVSSENLACGTKFGACCLKEKNGILWTLHARVCGQI